MFPKKFANSFKKWFMRIWRTIDHSEANWSIFSWNKRTLNLKNNLVFKDWQQKLLLKTDAIPPPLPENLGQFKKEPPYSIKFQSLIKFQFVWGEVSQNKCLIYKRSSVYQSHPDTHWIAVWLCCMAQRPKDSHLCDKDVVSDSEEELKTCPGAQVKSIDEAPSCHNLEQPTEWQKQALGSSA